MLKKPGYLTVVLVVVSFALSSCAPSLEMLKMRDENITVPAGYGVTQSEETPAEPGEKITEEVNWKHFFKDAPLTGLIDVALQKNQELAILEQEIKVANNEIMAREGEYIPKLGFKGGAGIDRVGSFTSQGKSDEATGVPKDLPGFNLGLTFSWEVDIWGKLRNATKAALYHYLATVDGRNFMVTRLVSEIADTYYELRALHKKVEILDQNIQIQQQALEIVRLQKQAARVTELAVKRFEAEVLKNQSRRYLLKQSIVEKENLLNFLSGRFPQPVDQGPTDFMQLMPRGIQAGVPTKLLENRPDVRQAGLELKSAKLSLDSARARFYPALSIEAGTGFQSFNAQHLFSTSDSLFYNLGANLVAPLLNRQGIKADYLSAGSKQLQAVYNYERAILNGYTDVVNQLNKVENLKGTMKLKAQQVAVLDKSVDISNTLFRAARCDYMEVLLTRRDSLDAQMDLVEVKQQQLSAVVNLYRALGGGWKQEVQAKAEAE
ncbi:efflux transporter outer membrane subunit [bacterium]|nr:efflux transporter outer membrane subunit [bacterium]